MTNRAAIFLRHLRKRSLVQLSPMPILAVLGIALIGTCLLINTHAATLVASSEPEDGSINSPASIATDTSASGGKSLKFGDGTTANSSVFGFEKATVWQDNDIISSTGGGGLNLNNATAVAAVTKDAEDMQAAGVTWARVWTAPSYSVATMQKLTSIYQAHNVHPLYLIYYSNESSAATETTLMNYLSSLIPAMSAMGEHYYEVGNEPNLDYSAGWNTCPTQDGSQAATKSTAAAAVPSYVVRLKDVYTQVHSLDSKGYVVLGGLSYNPSYTDYCAITSSSWIAEFIKPQYEGWKYLDCFGIHPYASDPSGVANNTTSTRNQLNASTNFKNIPLCLTEVGFWANGYAAGTQSTGHISSTDENVRASYYPQMMDNLKAIGINTPVFWYTWYDFTQAYGYGITHYGGPTTRTYLPIYTTMTNYKP